MTVTSDATIPDTHEDDPWDGIPAEALDAASYDSDTAGGCG